MANKIRLGFVGARGPWAARAHLPALKSLPEFEIKAVCTTSEATAQEAARAVGAPLAFHDYNAMANHPEVDAVVACVRVPHHYEIVMAALRAGKHVYSEWPLGANLREAEEMASLARSKAVRNVVGLQSRGDPALNYLRELVLAGYVGDVLTANLTLFSGGVLERSASRTWQGDRTKGAHVLTILAGHAIDGLCFCLGEFAEVSAKVATQVKQWRVSDTGGAVDTDSPDNVLVSGVLEGGAVASVHVASVPFNGRGWRLEVYGRDGTIFASTDQMPQMAAPQLMGARRGEPLAPLSVPDRFTLVPEDTPKGPPHNVGQLYVRLAEGIREARNVQPDFDLAVRRHRLLDSIQRASDEGKTLRLS